MRVALLSNESDRLSQGKLQDIAESIYKNSSKK